MGKFIDLTGKRFGRLTVIKRGDDYISPKGHTSIRWECLCDCQLNIPEDEKRYILVRGCHLKNNSIQSCGCLQKEITSKTNKKYNQYDLTGEYGIGYTSKGEEFYFDLEDYDKIKDYYWYISNNGYVISSNEKYLFHRVVMNMIEDNIFEIDHIHGRDTTNDNRKINLRIATHIQNNRNKIKQSNNTSGYVGVGWHKGTKKWRSYIIVDNKQIELGLFDNIEDAVKTRKTAEEKYFGEWSYSNSQKY